MTLPLTLVLLFSPEIPGEDGDNVKKPTRFYIGGVLSSTATARAFTMEAQVTFTFLTFSIVVMWDILG